MGDGRAAGQRGHAVVTLAAVDLSNLLYLAGALVAATLVSAGYVLRHRRPRSMEAAINEFSRELRALAPDSEPRQPAATSRPTASGPAGETGADAGSTARGRTDRARSRARERGDRETG
jgi:hypothetical protein